MKTRLIPLCLLLAAFLAAGSQWDFIQVFAWGRMYARNVRALPARDALAETFNPAKRCALCRAVSAARESQENQSQPTGTKILKEIVLGLAPRSLFLAHPVETTRLSSPDWATPEAERPSPPVPPPRAA